MEPETPIKKNSKKSKKIQILIAIAIIIVLYFLVKTFIGEKPKEEKSITEAVEASITSYVEEIRENPIDKTKAITEKIHKKAYQAFSNEIPESTKIQEEAEIIIKEPSIESIEPLIIDTEVFDNPEMEAETTIEAETKSNEESINKDEPEDETPTTESLSTEENGAPAVEAPIAEKHIELDLGSSPKTNSEQEETTGEPEVAPIEAPLNENVVEDKASLANNPSTETMIPPTAYTKPEPTRNPEINRFVANIHISTIIHKDKKSKMTIDGRIYSVGDEIDTIYKLRWSRVSQHRVYFEDENGFTYSKKI